MKRKQTSEQLIQRIFNRIFLLLTVLNIVAVVGYSVVRVSQTESQVIMDGLTSQKIDNLNALRFQTLGGFVEQTDFIRIYSSNGQEMLSKGTENFLKAPNVNVGKITLSNHQIFDHVYLEKNGMSYELWLSVNAIFQDGLVMLAVMIGLMLLTYWIGLWLIRRYSRKLSDPIVQLSNGVNANLSQLEIPENPQEVRDLAVNFNRLIGELNQKIMQEEQFAADAAHELRTPVTGIKGYVSLLKRRWKTHPEVIEESLDYLEEETERMKNLIEELLSLQRTQIHQPNVEKIDLSNLIQSIVKRIQITMKQPIKIDGKPNVFVKSDRLALQEILLIFLENAGIYSPKESEIIVKFDQNEIQIIDSGIGVPDEAKAKIFNRFYRVDQSREERKGTGIGLSIAREYAKKNNLLLEVSDNQPNGSIFHVKFSENLIK